MSKEFEDHNDYDAKSKEEQVRVSEDSIIYDKKRKDTPTEAEIRQLSKRDQFLYFKEYRLPYILISLVIILGLVWVFHSIHTTDKQKDTFYCGMMAGVQFPEEIQEQMPELFATYLEETGYDGYINKKRTYFEIFYATYTDDIKMDGYFDQRKFDTFISRSEQFEIYASNGNIYDLSKVLPEELLEKLSDRLIYASIDGGESVPYGILLKDIGYDFCDGNGDSVDPPILSIPSNTKRLDAAVRFVEFITKNIK